jgi:hypothetical protein
MTDQLAVVQQQNHAYLAAIREQVRVSCPDSERAAREAWAQADGAIKVLEDQLKAVVTPFKESIKSARAGIKNVEARYAEVSAPLRAATEYIGAQITAYHRELDAQQREAAERARRLALAAQTAPGSAAAQRAVAQAREAVQEVALAVPEEVQGAKVKDVLDVRIASYPEALRAMAQDLESGVKIRSDVQKAVLAWAKAEAKRGRCPAGVCVTADKKMGRR